VVAGAVLWVYGFLRFDFDSLLSFRFGDGMWWRLGSGGGWFLIGIG
jgi:hypothetical protein